MRWWQVAGGVLVVLLALAVWSNTAGPRMSGEVETPLAGKEGVRVVVVDEEGREVNAEVWRKGTAWCARAEGYLPDCTHGKDGEAVIVLRRDPGAEAVEVNVTGCSFFAYGPAGAPVIGPEECGKVMLKRGRYVFVLFDGNGRVVGEYNVLVRDETAVEGKGDGAGEPAVVRFHDGESGEKVKGWLTVKGFSLRGREVVIAVEECRTVFGWGRGYKKKDFRACPGKELNAFLPRQLGGGTLVVSAPGADRIVVTDREGAVLDAVEGDELRLENVPPGAYVVYAEDGASVTAKRVDVGEGQEIVTVDLEPGTATLVTSGHAEVYAMGEKVAEGKGALSVPARTVLHVVLLWEEPREEVTILLPGEVNVI